MRKTGLIDAEQERVAHDQERPDRRASLCVQRKSGRQFAPSRQGDDVRVESIVGGCEFKNWRISSRGSASLYPIAPREGETLASDLQSLPSGVDSFCNWCVNTHRLMAIRSAAWSGLNAETDVRHPRRALTPDEVAGSSSRLETSGKYVNKYSAGATCPGLFVLVFHRVCESRKWRA